MTRTSLTGWLFSATLVVLFAVAPSTVSAQGSREVRVPPPGEAAAARRVIVTPPAHGLELHRMQGRPADRDLRWMLVGGGLVIGGAIIGDDVGTIVSLSGLVIGGIGLYRYLR